MKNKGFTLVEVMVAVAIVGVLAGLAVPNYFSNIAKGRQSEAKIALASIYAAEINFGIETGFYSGCLRQLGYIPISGDARYYTQGFANTTANATTCGSLGTASCTIYVASPVQNCTVNALTGNNAISFTDNSYSASARANSGAGWPLDANLPATSFSLSGGLQTFVTGAAGNIKPGSATYDKWTIDNSKNLVNVTSGI